MTFRLQTALTTALIVCAASAIQAQESTRYVLSGEHAPLGAFHMTLDLTELGRGDYAVTVTRRYGAEQGVEVVQTGQGSRAGDLIRFEALSAPRGARGALESLSSSSSSLILELRDGDRIAFSSGRDALGTSNAAGQLESASSPEPATRDEDADGLREELEQKGKHLLALGREALADASHRGVDLRHTFRLSDYFHLGLGAGVRVVDPAAWTPGQRLSASERTRPVWLATTVRGGVRVPLTTEIPLGDVNLTLGFRAAAQVDYEVTDVYEVPDSFRDSESFAAAMQTLRERSFDLPLTAGEAQALAVGASSVLDGYGSVAVSGEFRFGQEVSDMGDVVRIGASSRVGGFYRVRGDLRVEVTRLMHNGVRLRVTRGETKTRESNADILIGAAVDEDALEDELGSSIEFISPGVLRDAVVSAAASGVEDVLRFQLKSRRTHEVEDELDISFRFDLGSSTAREAYDRALRGDLTHAETVSAQPNSGVIREFRVLDVEDRTYLGADLNVSVLLSAGASRRVSMSEIVVDDAVNGSKTFDIFRFNRGREFSLLGGREDRERTVEVELIRETDADGQVRRSFRYAFGVKDPHTTKPDSERFRRVLAALGLETGSALPTPEFRLFRSRYGKTRSSLEVQIAERGLNQILSVSPEQAFRAYVAAFTAIRGEVPIWATEAGRRAIGGSRSHGGANARNRARKNQLRRAERFVKNLSAVDPTANAEDRAEALERLAKSAGYQLYTVLALVNLAPRETVSARANMAGERISVNDAETGSNFSAVTMHDPR